MNREIKFRVWLKDAKCFAEIRHISFFEGKTVVKIYDQPMSEEIWFELEDLELLQYTGLKDNNDVEIYEGDIVKGKTTDHEEEGFYMHINGEVGFDNGSFNIKNPLMTYYRWTNYEIEVIGNIYENPELLEATK